MRAPDAPKGWPSDTPPPLMFTRLDSRLQGVMAESIYKRNPP